MVRSLCLAAVLTLLPLAPAAAQFEGRPWAQPRRASPEERNAALRYWAAWSAIDKEAARKIGDIDWQAIGEATTDLPDSLTGAAAAIPAWAIDSLVESSRLSRCDFEIEYEKGVETMLPHLSLARSGARALRADARVKLAAGDVSAAAERIAAIYRISGHISQDHIMISSLVGMAMASLASSETRTLIASGALTVGARDTIVRAIEGLDQADPYHMRMAVTGEHQITVDWIKRNFTGEDAGRRFVERMKFDLNADSPVDPQLARLNGDQLAFEADRLSKYYEAALAAWGHPDSVALLGALGKDIEDRYGLVAAVAGAALGNARRSDLKAQQDLRDTLTALKAAKVAR